MSDTEDEFTRLRAVYGVSARLTIDEVEVLREAGSLPTPVEIALKPP